ncbi:MAG: FHA domain-containing protein [Phycisphaerae bacterium]|nr:FHA domain-containing protein [Phycisphaerae bacterium]
MDVKLVMFKANGQRKDFPVAGDVTIVGRGDECDLRVPLTDVSRRHCELRIEGGKLVVADLGSSNGTFVNNKRVTESPLRAGDLLTLGPVSFVVQLDGKPAGVTAPAATKKKKSAAAPMADDDDEVVELDVDDEEEAIVLDEDDDDAADALAQLGEAGSDDGDDDDIFSALEAMADDKKKKK